MQTAQVQSLIWKDPTCSRATKSVSHNYCVCAPEPRRRHYWAHVSVLMKPTCPRACALQWEAPAPQESSPRSSQLEKSPCSYRDPAMTPQTKISKYLKKNTQQWMPLKNTGWGGYFIWFINSDAYFWYHHLNAISSLCWSFWSSWTCNFMKITR